MMISTIGPLLTLRSINRLYLNHPQRRILGFWRNSCNIIIIISSIEVFWFQRCRGTGVVSVPYTSGMSTTSYFIVQNLLVFVFVIIIIYLI